MKKATKIKACLVIIMLVIISGLIINAVDSHFRKKQLEQFGRIGIGSTSSQVKDVMGYLYDSYQMDVAHQDYLNERLNPASIDFNSDRVFHYKAGWVWPNRLILFFKNDLLTKKSIVQKK